MCSCNNCKAHMSAISAQRGGGWFVGGELSAAVGDHWACAQHRHRAHATEEEGGGEGELRTIFEGNFRGPGRPPRPAPRSPARSSVAQRVVARGLDGRAEAATGPGRGAARAACAAQRPARGLVAHVVVYGDHRRAPARCRGPSWASLGSPAPRSPQPCARRA